MTQHWAWQFGKLRSVMSILATHPGDARARVFAAAYYLLQISPDLICHCLQNREARLERISNIQFCDEQPSFSV